LKQYIQPFIDVCKSVFHDFVKMDPEAKVPFFLERGAQEDWDISGVIGFTGEARGAVVISMKQHIAIKITTSITGTVHKTVDDDVVDAVGELINIIAGNVKQGLEEAYRLVISLPTIIRGKDHSLVWPDGKARVIVIPFTINNVDSFSLSIALEAVKGDSKYKGLF